MSKAEEFATFMVEELIRKWVSEGRIQDSVRQASLIRECLIIGYNQAEKDLVLTWEDMKLIQEIQLNVCAKIVRGEKMTEKEQFGEVLKLFNEQKGDKV